MRELFLLFFIAAAIIADIHAAPATRELAEIEELLAAAKNRDELSNEESLRWPYSNMVRTKEKVAEQQRNDLASEFPQAEILSDRNKEVVDTDSWHWTIEHPFASQHSGEEKETAETEHHNADHQMKNETPAGYLSRQQDRMHNFLKEQEKRMLGYLDRQRNTTLSYVRYERNRTLEYMRRESNNTLELLRRMQPINEAEKQEDKEVEEAMWRDSSFKGPQLPPPNTFLRDATSIRIPTSQRQQEMDDMEVARIQGFLRKLAPYILKKLSG